MADYCKITLTNLKMFSTELSDISVNVPHCSNVPPVQHNSWL